MLERALTHRSYCAENPSTTSNERLEFLGDSVLGLVVTNHIFGRYPDLPEGQLAKLRASVVNTITLANLATDLELGELLLLGKGRICPGGGRRNRFWPMPSKPCWVPSTSMVAGLWPSASFWS